MRTILDAVRAHAEARPDDPCFDLVSSRKPAQRRTWAEVFAQAGRVAACLAGQGIGAGDIVVLIGTHDADLPACWLGCVWAGAVPTILAEPSVRIDRALYWSRLDALLQRIGARVLLVGAGVDVGPDRPRIPYAEAVGFDGPAPTPATATEQTLLLLQHSSGTTGLQKGVMLSHGAVMRHAASYGAALGLTAADRIATWLPLYHDMGMIACFVTPLIAGVPVTWLSPFEWVAQPTSLLTAIAKHRATHVWLPNFAYGFLAQRAREPRGTFDLSSVKAVINCSEPVTADAMDAFAERFAGDGFDRAALHACYAMAENVFAVSTSTAVDPARRRRVSKQRWAAEHRAVIAEPEDADVAIHISNGRVVDGCELKIADAAGPGCAGRVLIRSPFLFDGYFRRDDLNSGLLDADGFFDTGDLGYLDVDGHVFITGRSKDLVIVGGRNVYPHDVEAVIGEVAGVHPGRVVVFGAEHKGLGTEGLIALVESDRGEPQWKDVERAIRASVPARLDLDLLDARVVARGTLRKSTSGKLARGGNREWYLAGRFGPVPPNVGQGGAP